MTDLTHYGFLLHHTPPVGVGMPPSLFYASEDKEVRRIGLVELSKIQHPIVTHSFSLLVEWFRRDSLPLPKTIVDLEVAKKLIVGRPKSDFDSSTPWDMSTMLQDFAPPSFDSDVIRAALTTHMAKPARSEFGNLRFMRAIVAKLPQLWNSIRHDLEANGEIQRFEEVEVPVYNTMLEVQYKGIAIDCQARHDFLTAIEDQFVCAHHELAINQKIDVERAFEDVNYLGRFISVPVRDFELFARPHDIIASRRNSDRLCGLLHTVKTARDNKRILLRTGVDDGFCFPSYDTLGTVTGRILIIDPQLQHVSKKYRGIIGARPGTELVYLDYSQFEPNIMASISKDAMLAELCRDNDLYAKLSSDLCGSARHRDAVKTMFLAYSYGKDIESLHDLLVECGMSLEEAADTIKKRFAPLFSGIETWKRGIENYLLAHGRIGTLFGNHRYRDVDGQLSERERRWAVSQLIQGTGALILKKVIIALRDSLPQVSMLLPMHDALLVEVPVASVAELTTEIITCFRRTFVEVCPAIVPAIKVKSFSEEILN